MTPNARLSAHVSILATIDPVSQAPGAVSTAYVSVKNHFALMAFINTGVLGAAATLDAKFQQATSAAGAGVKDVTGKAIVQIVKATGDNKEALLNMKVADLDTEGGFSFVRLTLTVAGAASLISAAVIGAYPRFEDASVFNQAGVVQVI